MASKDKTDRIISMVRGALYVDVVVRVGGRIQELRYSKEYTDREIRNMVLDTRTPPLLGEDSIMIKEKAQQESEVGESQRTVPMPQVVVKNRATRQEMIVALKSAGVTGVNVNNRNALETAYAQLRDGDK